MHFRDADQFVAVVAYRLFGVVLVGSLLVFAVCGWQGVSRSRSDTVATPTVSPVSPSGSQIQDAPAVLPPDTSPDEAAGPFFELLRLNPSELEQKLGKPSDIQAIGMGSGVFTWHYQKLGLAFDITTQLATGKQFVTGVVQTRGFVYDSIRVGDTEQHAAELGGPMRIGGARS